MKYLLGIDIGTSGTKTILMQEDGLIITAAVEGYELHQPQNGWAEQNPEDWWKATQKTIRTILKRSCIYIGDIAGIGLTGQMHGLVMLDKAGKVLRPSIIWCDQRSGEQCNEIARRVGAKQLLRITANPATTGFTLSKLLWVREHEPEIYDKCYKIFLPKDYIRYRLTGDCATDVSDASGMQMLDISNRRWSSELLSALEIDRALLGDVYESPVVTGVISKEAAKQTGLKAGTIVVAGAGDNAAGAVGTGVVDEGSAFTTIGSSGVVFAHSNNPIVDNLGRVHTFCCAVPGAWHVMGVTQSAGLSLKWFRDVFCQSEANIADEMKRDIYELMDFMASESPVGANRLIYLPYLLGERTPHLDPDCRGVFFGLSAIHQKRDIIRAIMEGVTYSLRNCYEIICEMGISIENMLVCGGGGSSPLWRQMIADVFNCSVYTAGISEGPAYGAAILAGVGAGIYSSVENACSMLIVKGDKFIPDKDAAVQYKKVYKIYCDLYPRLKDNFKQLINV